MDDPAVHCTTCRYAWRSPIMAHGLRSIGSCPRCGGELRFHVASPAGEPRAESDVRDARAPHLVLGLPRR